ncbi:MAG: hypothetical protein KAI14_03720, partial [Dehalococcoidales bacterium]|nr:hypothetical protein [Dehalococcoidales bacterium]
MKKRITKIVGVVLSLALLSSLAMVAPVSAIADPDVLNDWETVVPGLPVAEDTDVDLLAVAADGTLFASVYDSDDDDWTIYKSSPNADGIAGWTWTKTKFADHDEEITAIVCAPNWDSNDTFYVGTRDGEVFRCIDAGATEPVLLRAIVGNDPSAPEDLMEASRVYDMDLWTDGGSIWIMVATDIDILVMEDALFAQWIDMDLTISFDGSHFSQDGTWQHPFDAALVGRFAPDFDQSGLIWAIIRDGWGDAWVTATISPGQWGQVVNSVEIDTDGSWLRSQVDLDFAEFYSSTSAPILFTALSAWGPNGDDLFLIEGGFNVDSTIATPLEVDGGGIDFQSIQVSNESILGGEFWNADVWISRNGGDTFDDALRPPSGDDETQVLMAPGAFDPDTGVAYAATRGSNSAFSYTMDGGNTWNQTAFVDTDIDQIEDLAFSNPTILITDDFGPPDESIWRTYNIDAENPQWERVKSEGDADLVEYSPDGSVLVLHLDDGGDVELWKSADDGQTFNHWRTLPAAMGDINAFVVYDGATVFAACEGGFFGTTRFGPAKQRLTTETLESVALLPGFDPNSDNDTVLVGNDDGKAFASADAGNTWGTGVTVGAGDVLVAFDSAGTPYFATSESTVAKATLSGNKITKVADVTDSLGGKATAESFSGIWVAPD